MRRRDILARVGPAGSVALAGCLGEDVVGAAPLETDDESTGGRDANDGNGSTATEDEAPAETIEVGDPDAVAFPSSNRPHRLVVRNATDDDVTLTITIDRQGADDGRDSDDGTDDDGATENETEDDGATENETGGADASENETDDAPPTDNPVLERDVDLSPETVLEVILHEPDRYAVVVDTAAATITRTVDREWFGCGDSKTVVLLAGDGTAVESTATLEECPAPRIDDWTLERGDGSCASDEGGDRATVRFDDGTVAISGGIVAPTPCHAVELASVAYDRSADRLEVVVAVGEEEDGVCVQCLGEVTYDAAVAFENDYPGTVLVVHERGDERVPVSRVACED